MSRRLRWLLALAPLLLAGAAEAVQLQPVMSGLSRPVYVTSARDGSSRLFVVEQGGVIKVLQPGLSVPTVFLDISGRVLAPADSEQGLLGLAFHPQYAMNNRFFVYYTQQPDGAIVISEFTRSSTNVNAASPTSERVLLVIPHPAFANHNGGMIAFGPDGFLYAGTGDGGGAFDPNGSGQNLASVLGKILRIDVNSMSPGLQYGIPAANPYAGTPTARKEIWALGLRNPYRFSFDRANGDILVGDVGQNSFEEIDRIPAGVGGLNMGWAVMEGPFCTGISISLCGNPAFTLPIAGYEHTGLRCAVVGGYVYRGPAGALPPGTYVFGDFCTGEIFSFNGAASAVLLNTAPNISSFGEDEAGELYVVNLNGTVDRLVGGATPATEPARQAFIGGLYATVLGRAPTPDELAAWANFLRANCNIGGVRTIARGFFGSPEFAMRPLTLTGQVTVLYGALLGRVPDPAGLAAWVDVLRQARLRLALAGFIPSAEFRALLSDRTNRVAVESVVTRFYTEILGRAPDPAGFNAWVDFVLATGSLETVAIGFLASPEFETVALRPGAYVTILYRSFLGRPPEPAGLAAWEAVMQASLLNVVEAGFLPAAEFNLAALCG